MNKKRFKLSLEKKFKPHERILQILFYTALTLTVIGVSFFFISVALLPHGINLGDGPAHNPIGGILMTIVLSMVFWPPLQLPITILLILGGISSLILQNITSNETKVLTYTFLGVPILIAAVSMLFVLSVALTLFIRALLFNGI